MSPLWIFFAFSLTMPLFVWNLPATLTVEVAVHDSVAEDLLIVVSSNMDSLGFGVQRPNVDSSVYRVLLSIDSSLSVPQMPLLLLSV
jgi:hypothetical protein